MQFQFPTYQTIENYILKNISLSFSFDVELFSLYEKHEGNLETEFINIYQTEPIFYEWKGFKFPVFIHNGHQNLINENGKISFDVILNVFIFVSGYLELISEERDHHDRFPFKSSLQKKYNFSEIPVVNIYFELLQSVANNKGEFFEEKKFYKSIIFTHDIDQFRSAWFENIQFYRKKFSFKSLIEIPRNILTKILKRDDEYFLAMKKMIAIDQEYQVESISFFIPSKSKMDADFEITEQKFLNLFKETEKHQTIGFHPGYKTFQDSKEFKRQKLKLETIAENKIAKSRQHFLRYDIAKTPYILEENGILEDYSLGFAEQYGFRNGIAYPFYLFDFKKQKAFKFKSIPLVFMDVTLTNYSLEKDFDSVFDFIQKINSNFNCNYSILFHNSVFTNTNYKGFQEFYIKLLKI